MSTEITSPSLLSHQIPTNRQQPNFHVNFRTTMRKKRYKSSRTLRLHPFTRTIIFPILHEKHEILHPLTFFKFRVYLRGKALVYEKYRYI